MTQSHIRDQIPTQYPQMVADIPQEEIPLQEGRTRR